ncbi:hypothetical protein TYRP_005506 [Tyrophagus putrescentiae]|nr:hypothetical protein TYRP_005506 [Tyrophagus putrescentiae]
MENEKEKKAETKSTTMTMMTRGGKEGKERDERSVQLNNQSKSENQRLPPAQQQPERLLLPSNQNINS